jgi:cytochrome c peroxidase
MNTVLSKIAKKGFARFLVAYLCLGLAAPAMPVMAAPGDITNNTGLIPFDQANFAFEVEGPMDSLKGVPTWDEIEHYLDNPYAFVLDDNAALVAAGYPNGPYPTWRDNNTARPFVDPATGAFLLSGTGNDQGWPSYRLTQGRRRAVYYRSTVDNTPCQPDPADATCVEVLRSFIFRTAGVDGILGTADDNTCAPGSPGCVEVPLNRFLVHPLNYNYQGGEELRILNFEYAGGVFGVPGGLLPAAPPEFLDNTCSIAGVPPLRPVYRYDNNVINVSPGIERLEDDEAAISYNSPIQSDYDTFGGEVCIRTLEPIFSPGPGPEGSVIIPEGVCLCGGDPGEPGHLGFGALNGFPDAIETSGQYTTPAVPGKTGPGTTFGVNGFPTPDPANVLLGGAVDNNLLFDTPRGFLYPRDEATGLALVGGVVTPLEEGLVGTMRKPSIRIPLEGCDPLDNTTHLRCGSGIAPNYLWNSEEALFARALEEALAEGLTDNQARLEAAEEFPAFLAPSNENDYIRNRDAAQVLGKAIFWDQQLGSDSVQSCGSCHFHAGADNRTKNQLNPNHLSGDFTFQLKGPNQEIEAADFPFHKLINIEIAGDPACIVPVVTPLGQVVCDASNIESDTNEVMSSMGVFFGNFGDIPPIGSFTPADNTGVRSVLPDIRTNTPIPWRTQLEAAVTLGRTDVASLNSGNLDPIPAFQDVRRVEPRNTPTLFASAMNFDNFWDGRARHDFNGGSVFGPVDPQSHVWVYDNNAGTLVPTRQIIRFVSLASLFTGPALSEFEMSHKGRNWQKIGKKLLQAGVTPLANQLVDPTDGVLGPYSNQPAPVGYVNACASLAVEDRSGSYGTGPAPGKPGLCISYPGLIRRAYFRALWENDGQQRIVGSTSGCTQPMLNGERDPVDPPNCDPFDGYVLALDNAVVNPADTSQFTQMEANVPLFFGLAVQAWGNILVPDDTGVDRFFDVNNDAFRTFGESGEPFLVLDLANCGPPIAPNNGQEGQVGVQSCFTEVGNFKRDSNTARAAAGLAPITARFNCSLENCEDGFSLPMGGTRQLSAPDPLLGLDFFLGSNMSLKNPRFRSLRCGECHAESAMADHTFSISHQMTFIDWVQEFVTPGHELFPEPLTRGRLAHPFALEGELQENAQDAVERNIADMELDEMGFPRGMALFDNGMYNIGVRPIEEDVGRGGRDPFGFPLSLGYLAHMNLGGVDNNGVWYSPGGDNPDDGFALPAYPGIPLPNWEPDPTAINERTGLLGHPAGGGLFEPTGQDFQINPGFAEEPVDPQLPPYLAKWASNVNVGDETDIDELFVGLNTLQHEAQLEGFVDKWGPFNPAATISEVNNNAWQARMGLWPNVNRVNAFGAVKAAALHNVELTGPYFHTGSKLTLRQQLDFYDRGGDFPISNSSHRDFLIIHFDIEDEALGGYIDPVDNTIVPPGTVGAVPEFTEEQKEAIKISMIDFLLELTDERVKFERAPFDHPEIFVPLDGRAPENTFGRPGFLANSAGLNSDRTLPVGSTAMFLRIPAVGEAGNVVGLPNFLNITSGPRCTPKAGGILAVPTGHPFLSNVYADIDECTGALSHYDSHTTRVVAAAGAVGSTNTGATVSSTGVASSASGSQLLARNAGSAVVVPKASSVMGVTLSADPGSPQADGATVTFTAEAFGGSGDYEYEYWATADYYNDGAPFIARSYSTSPSWSWAASPGNFTFFVKARKVGSTADAEATSTEVPFAVE